MKRAELKEMLKPLVEECIREALFENGILASVISEVLQGVQGASVIRESAPAVQVREVDNTRQEQADAIARQQASKKLQEQRQKMLSAIGNDSYNGVNVFEGTTPLKGGGTPGGSPKPGSPLSGMDPRDPGVDISGLTESMSGLWQKLAGGK